MHEFCLAVRKMRHHDALDEKLVRRVENLLQNYACFSPEEMKKNSADAAERVIGAHKPNVLSSRRPSHQRHWCAQNEKNEKERHHNHSSNRLSTPYSFSQRKHDAAPLLSERGGGGGRGASDKRQKKTCIHKASNAAFLGVLNKLNTSNYTRQFEVLRRMLYSKTTTTTTTMIDDDAVLLHVQLVDSILEKSYTQTFYVDLFVHLLFHLLEVKEKEEEEEEEEGGNSVRRSPHSPHSKEKGDVGTHPGQSTCDAMFAHVESFIETFLTSLSSRDRAVWTEDEDDGGLTEQERHDRSCKR